MEDIQILQRKRAYGANLNAYKQEIEGLNKHRKIITEENKKLKQQNEHLKDLLKDVASCGYKDIDPRIDYLEVQVDRDIWAELQEVIGEE